MAPHVKSKRQTLRHKYKVAKKVRQHHRNVRRANRKKPEVRKIKSKDPGIPNLWPYKQQMLEAIERKKAEQADAKKALQAARREALRAAADSGGPVDSALAHVVADAKFREQQFEANGGGGGVDVVGEGKDGGEGDHGNGSSTGMELGMSGGPVDASRRAFMREFRKVVDSSDVILEVLDARDPLGCRCFEAERMITAASGGSKRIVLVLNKVDLVPRHVTDRWLAYLRNDYPTIAFRASVQEGRTRRQAAVPAVAANSVGTSDCLGASSVLSLLKNYCRSRELKTSIAVGVIGYPNVGKSSLINSLKRSRAVNSGAAPGVTRNAQEVHLDSNVRLIDCPGIVFARDGAEALVLRNCIKVENLHDAVSPVETIIRRVGAQPLMVAYGFPAFDTTAEFLACVCKMRGKFRAGGSFDIEAAARMVLRDWNNGHIPFYTLPPKGPRRAQLGAEVVRQWGEEFNIGAVEREQKEGLSLFEMTAQAKARFAKAKASEGGGDVVMGEGDQEKGDDGEEGGDGEGPSFHVAVKDDESMGVAGQKGKS